MIVARGESKLIATEYAAVFLEMSSALGASRWYSVLYLNHEDDVRVATQERRIHWVASRDLLARVRDDEWSWGDLESPQVGSWDGPGDQYCDVAELLYELDEPGRMPDPRAAYETINTLDDLVKSIDHPLGPEAQAVIDRFLDGPFDGVPDGELLEHVGRELLMEAIMAALGRIFANSDFLVEDAPLVSVGLDGPVDPA